MAAAPPVPADEAPAVPVSGGDISTAPAAPDAAPLVPGRSPIFPISQAGTATTAHATVSTQADA
jgi:hypothetical protein